MTDWIDMIGDVTSNQYEQRVGILLVKFLVMGHLRESDGEQIRISHILQGQEG